MKWFTVSFQVTINVLALVWVLPTITTGPGLISRPEVSRFFKACRRNDSVYEINTQHQDQVLAQWYVCNVIHVQCSSETIKQQLEIGILYKIAQNSSTVHGHVPNCKNLVKLSSPKKCTLTSTIVVASSSASISKAAGCLGNTIQTKRKEKES